MTATFTIHLEMAETDVAWWAETVDVEHLSIAAPTLMGLRRLIDEAVATHLERDTEVVLVLSSDGEDTGTAAERRPDAIPAARGAEFTRAFLTNLVA
jgi:hypothetical protein